MRRLLLVAAALVMATSVPLTAYAQMGGGGGGPGGGGGGGRRGGGDQQDDSAKKKKKDSDWGNNQAPLPALRNAGPCPFVKTLYDASRYVEFKDSREASANVGFSGEIQGISAGCQYKDDQPIQVVMDVLFEMGKGPQAQGSAKTYHYWVAVTDRNREVIAKQSFDLPVSFAAGQDRVYVTEHLKNVTIPRGTATTSGANFEILVGFDVTPEMAEFNRQGKRFRLNAGAATVAAEGASQPR
ncbi:MAG: hypothetical protein JWQ46_1343 [Phenylobacterium sp.]|nr:hypothetical protein [Phenylobacterium sp.]